MKKTLFALLLLVFAANAKVTQKSVLGNWTMKPAKAAPNDLLTLEKDTLVLTDSWKYTEKAVYNVNYPAFGPKKVDLQYKMLVHSSGQYRLEGDGIKKYIEKFEPEIFDANDEDVAHTSLREIERMIKEEAKAILSVLEVTETDLELQNPKGTFKFSKPKKLPVSKLTAKQVPFFAPEDWRYPDSAKELAEWAVRLKNDKNLFTIVEADFNGDKSQDAVAYLMNDQTGQVALFLNLSQPDGSYLLEPFGSADRSATVDNGVFLAPAGEYTNVSTKQKFTIENPGFMIVIFGTAANLNYFDGRNWQTVPLGKRF